MRITFSSVLMSVFWSGILTGIIYMMRRKCRYVKNFGIGCVVMVYLFCMMRLFLPIDFSFTKGIDLQGAFSSFYNTVCYRKYHVGEYVVSIADGLMIFWFLVSAVLILRFICEYRSVFDLLKNLETREDEQCARILEQVFEYKGKRRAITVLKSRWIAVPMGIGIFHRKILLPDLEYTDQKLYYILLHEYTHFLNGDLVIKMMVHIFCCIFWWNPMVYLLKKDLDQSLELKCDLCITENLSSCEAANYLQTIVSTLKASGKRRRFMIMNDASAMASGKKSEIVERFEYILENQKSTGRKGRSLAIWIIAFCFVWVSSYSFIPLPSFEPSVPDFGMGRDCLEITPDNFSILYKNGKYYWFIEGQMKEEVPESSAKILEHSGFEIRRK